MNEPDHFSAVAIAVGAGAIVLGLSDVAPMFGRVVPFALIVIGTIIIGLTIAWKRSE